MLLHRYTLQLLTLWGPLKCSANSSAILCCQLSVQTNGVGDAMIQVLRYLRSPCSMYLANISIHAGQLFPRYAGISLRLERGVRALPLTHRCSWSDTMMFSFASPAKCAFQSFRVVQEKRHRGCCTGQAVAILCHLAQSAYVRREAQLEPTPRSPSLGLGSGSLAVPTILCC